MHVRQGDVVLVAVDYTDRTGGKVRPAIVVSGTRFNQGPDRLLAPLTSNLGALPHPGDHVLADWRGAGLHRPSVVQTKVFVVEQSLIVDHIGTLQPPDRDALARGLREALDL